MNAAVGNAPCRQLAAAPVAILDGSLLPLFAHLLGETIESRWWLLGSPNEPNLPARTRPRGEGGLKHNLFAPGGHDGGIPRIPAHSGGIIALSPSPACGVNRMVKLLKVADQGHFGLENTRCLADIQSDVGVNNIAVWSFGACGELFWVTGVA